MTAVHRILYSYENTTKKFELAVNHIKTSSEPEVGHSWASLIQSIFKYSFMTYANANSNFAIGVYPPNDTLYIGSVKQCLLFIIILTKLCKIGKSGSLLGGKCLLPQGVEKIVLDESCVSVIDGMANSSKVFNRLALK